MRAVVTGATGFLGKWLVEELLNQGYDVLAIARDISKIPSNWNNRNDVRSVQCTLDDYSILLENDVCVENAEVFFHLAWAGTSGMERADVSLQLANVQATCDAVRLAKEMGCKRFIHSGSIMEYETIKSFSIDGFIPSMGSIYSIAKTASDYMARTVAAKEGIDYINVIISNIYGEGERSARFINTTLRKMLAGEKLELTKGTQKYDFIYVSDAVKAIVLVAEKGKTFENYYIGNSEQILLKEYVLDMHKTVGSLSELQFGKVKMGSVSLEYSEFDTYKLERELGFKAEVDFKEGIMRLSKWIQSEDKYEY